MKKIRYVTTLGILLLAGGCATKGTSTIDRIAPNAPTFTYEKTVNRTHDEAWDILVRNMAKSFFVINNIDKNSRIINLSYSSDRPQDYVDCGRSKRTFSDGKVTQTYEHGNVDNIATYKVAPTTQEDPRFSSVSTIIRKATLDGRANVYVAPESNGTLISVNAKSVVRISLSGEMVTSNFAGQVMARRGLTPATVDVTGVTRGGTENTVVVGTNLEKITCYSTGNLEKAILELIN